MVKALAYQGKSGWFSLMDKVSSGTALSRAWARVGRSNTFHDLGLFSLQAAQDHALHPP